jgi:hypothetical protein
MPSASPLKATPKRRPVDLPGAGVQRLLGVEPAGLRAADGGTVERSDHPAAGDLVTAVVDRRLEMGFAGVREQQLVATADRRELKRPPDDGISGRLCTGHLQGGLKPLVEVLGAVLLAQPTDDPELQACGRQNGEGRGFDDIDGDLGQLPVELAQSSWYSP